MLAHDLRYTDDTDTIALTVMDNTRAVTAHKDLNIVCWNIEEGRRFEIPSLWSSKDCGKRVRIVAETVLLMIVSMLHKPGHICWGYKMFLKKIKNILCVSDTNQFVSATNVARGGKHLCPQHCVAKGGWGLGGTHKFV